MAAVGLIESLMTMSLIDELTETRGRGNRECIGQGVANVLTGFLGGMGGCAMIGQSMINIRSVAADVSRNLCRSLPTLLHSFCFQLYRNDSSGRPDRGHDDGGPWHL